MTKKEIYLKIYMEMKKQEITGTELAEKLGVGRSAVSLVLNKLKNEKNINFENLEKICNVLNLEIIIKEKN